MKRAIAITLLALAGEAAAQSDSAPASDSDSASASGTVLADLRLKSPPVATPNRLLMRPAPPAPAVAGPAIAAGADAAADATIDTGFKVVPTDIRDLQERVIFKVNVGYGLDSAPASGDPLRSGFVPDDITDPDGNALAEQRQYLLGDAILGTRGILMPSLHTYFLSQYSLDADGASQFASLNNVYDQRDGRALLVHSAYAEIDDLEDDESILGRLFLRAGRQFRYGSTMFIANFDGVSGGYDSPGFEATGFFGQRVSLFFGDDPGLLGGGGIKVRLKDLVNVPVDLSADYLYFDGGGPADETLDDGTDFSRQYLELAARTNLAGWRFYGRARLADNGVLRADEMGQEPGFKLGRLGLEGRKAFGKSFVLIADVEQRFEDEVAYDFLMPNPTDVLDIAERLGIGLDPQQATRVSARGSYMVTRASELYAFVRANLASGVEESGFNRSWQEAGAAVSHRVGRKIFATAQYKLRLTDLDDDANQVGDEFTNTAGTGVGEFHELAADARYSLGYRTMTVGAGAYYRVYDVQSPYAVVSDDGRGGARFDVDYWFSEALRAKFAGEVAQPSPAFAPELDTIFSIRALLEAIF